MLITEDNFTKLTILPFEVNIVDMYFERDFAPKLIKLSNQFPVLFLTGARQTGKTTLLKKIFPNHSYVSLDLPSLAEQAETTPDLFFAQHPTPLIIDEVQYAPGIFRHIKRRVDAEIKHGQFILTGSQKFPLMKNVSESLAGRCVWVELENLSLSEITAKIGERQDHAFILELISRGQFPELWNQKDLSTNDFFASYVATYLERDVRQILNVGNLRNFERVIRMLAARSGQLLNRSEIAKETGISIRAIGDWIHVLQVSNQVFLIEPWFANFSKRIVKSPKLYFADTGLLCFLLAISQKALAASPFLGHVFETFVYSELRKRNAIAVNPYRIWYYRDQRAREIDFILERDATLSFIECKWTDSPGKKDAHVVITMSDELEASKSLVRPGKHWIVSMTANEYAITENVEAIGPGSFGRVFE